MSFLTWRWLLPQKLQRSCSLPSDALATVFFYLGSRFIARDTGLGFGSVLGAVSMDDDVVDDAVVQESRVDVERALAARGLFDHHRDQRAHAGSLLPGVHSFVSVGEDSLSGVQMLSRARATSAGTRCTSLAIRSSALRRRRSPRRVSAPPLSKTCLIASSASSPCASACSRTSSSISASDTSSPSLSATASSTSSRPTESCASARICSTSCSPVWPVSWR